ncbi:CHASE2 domain-containing protein [Pseudoxanthomonas koreensis]|uniref:CHASE2 domain-containing protein n=1 Tax=Pseudoxanthomonas koreensis TaxID=266061 RepID=UPI0013916A24|nr:CHASE2 domain-containing protein [Pseudoxanthomonas koreensis]
MASVLGVAVALDDALYAQLATRAAPAYPPPVTVVGLTGAESWSNARLASLLEQLQVAGARGIALDMPLRSDPADPAGDARLARALLDDRMVLGVALQAGDDARPRASMPPVEFADAARLAHVWLPRDRDGRIRGHLPHVVSLDGIRWPSLALALVRSGDAVGAGRMETPARWRVAYDNGQGPAPRTLHASDVLQGNAGTGLLGDHWVLVGVTDPARLAPLPGPYGSPTLYPVEHEARAMASLLQGTVSAPLSAAVQALLSLLLAGGAVLLGLGERRSTWRMPLALLAGIAGALLLAIVLLHWRHWFAPGGVVLVLAAILASGCLTALRRRLRDRRRLPGLATRGRLASAVHAVRTKGTAHALLLLEVPGGVRGGQAVDDAAARIARLLQARARRPGDLAAHLGGGRFALLLPGTSATAAERILEEIRAQAAEPGTPLRLAGSIHACADESCDCLRHLAPRTAPASAG